MRAQGKSREKMMATRTPNQAAVTLAKMGIRVFKAVMEAERVSGNDARRTAVKLSSGKFSTLKLRLMHGPYSTRDPHPPDDPAIINKQTGLFRSSWHIDPPA